MTTNQRTRKFGWALVASDWEQAIDAGDAKRTTSHAGMQQSTESRVLGHCDPHIRLENVSLAWKWNKKQMLVRSTPVFATIKVFSCWHSFQIAQTWLARTFTRSSKSSLSPVWLTAEWSCECLENAHNFPLNFLAKSESSSSIRIGNIASGGVAQKRANNWNYDGWSDKTAIIAHKLCVYVYGGAQCVLVAIFVLSIHWYTPNDWFYLMLATCMPCPIVFLAWSNQSIRFYAIVLFFLAHNVLRRMHSPFNITSKQRSESIIGSFTLNRLFINAFMMFRWQNFFGFSKTKTSLSEKRKI